MIYFILLYFSPLFESRLRRFKESYDEFKIYRKDNEFPDIHWTREMRPLMKRSRARLAMTRARSMTRYTQQDKPEHLVNLVQLYFLYTKCKIEGNTCPKDFYAGMHSSFFNAWLLTGPPACDPCPMNQINNLLASSRKYTCTNFG